MIHSVLGRFDHSLLILVASLLSCVTFSICDSRHTGGWIKRLLSALFFSSQEHSLHLAVRVLYDRFIGRIDD